MNLQERKPNFRSEEGKLFLVRCFICNPEEGKENWVGAVASGRCVWCGWPGDVGLDAGHEKGERNRYPWTPEEESLLIDAYGRNDDLHLLAKRLGRTVAAVRHVVFKLQLFGVLAKRKSQSGRPIKVMPAVFAVVWQDVYRSGGSMRDAAKILGLCLGSVYRHSKQLRADGMNLKPQERAVRRLRKNAVEMRAGSRLRR